jgi:ATP-dependent Clp protease adapter protein ClpS
LYNDNHNAYDNVVLWLQKSTGCSQDRANDICATAHKTGRAICYGGDREKCQEVAAYLRGKGLQVEVDNASD